MFILIDDIEKILDVFDLSSWLIPMPFQIRSLPVNFPDSRFPYIGRLCNRLFYLLAPISPVSPNFENNYALIFDSKSQIYFLTDFHRRPPFRQEAIHRDLNPLYFKF